MPQFHEGKLLTDRWPVSQACCSFRYLIRTHTHTHTHRITGDAEFAPRRSAPTSGTLIERRNALGHSISSGFTGLSGRFRKREKKKLCTRKRALSAPICSLRRVTSWDPSGPNHICAGPCPNDTSLFDSRPLVTSQLDVSVSSYPRRGFSKILIYLLVRYIIQ